MILWKLTTKKLLFSAFFCTHAAKQKKNAKKCGSNCSDFQTFHLFSKEFLQKIMKTDAFVQRYYLLFFSLFFAFFLLFFFAKNPEQKKTQKKSRLKIYFNHRKKKNKKKEREFLQKHYYSVIQEKFFFVFKVILKIFEK